MNDRFLPWIVALGVAFAALLLGWLFWPVHSGGYPPAPNAICRSNMKLIGLGLIMYATDYDGRFPNRDNWMDVLVPYSKNEGIFHDPVVAKQGKQFYGYAFNGELSQANVPSKPETVPMVFDSVNLARNASGSLDSLPDPARHEGSNHVCYADGSVKTLPGKTSK